MTPLVGLLRYHGLHCLTRGGEQSEMCLDAAAEIERLRIAVLLAVDKLGALRSAAYDEKKIALAELCEEFRLETLGTLEKLN